MINFSLFFVSRENHDTYEEMKSILLLGRHMEAVGFLHECLNAGDYLPPGAEYVSGIRVEKMAITNDGDFFEFIYFIIINHELNHLYPRDI